MFSALTSVPASLSSFLDKIPLILLQNYTTTPFGLTFEINPIYFFF
jgi:hypothetical protein